MDTRFSVKALVDLVHRYYPVGIYGDDPRYRESEEYKRLTVARLEAQKDDAAWKGFRLRVREQLPECKQWELPGLLYDPSRRLRVHLPHTQVSAGEHKDVVVLTSILAPVHLIYASHTVSTGEETSESRALFAPLPPEFQFLEAKLDALVRDSFGTVRLPNEILFTPVPDLQVGNIDLGAVKLLHCLFTEDIW